MSGGTLPYARAFSALVMSIAVGGAACGPGSRETPSAEGADAGGGGGGGEATCESGAATVCQGDAVHACNADGTVGGVLGVRERLLGRHLRRAAAATRAAAPRANDLIYVVTRSSVAQLRSALARHRRQRLSSSASRRPAGAPWRIWRRSATLLRCRSTATADGLGALPAARSSTCRSPTPAAQIPVPARPEGFSFRRLPWTPGIRRGDPVHRRRRRRKDQIGDLGRANQARWRSHGRRLPDSGTRLLTGTGTASSTLLPGRSDSWVARLGGQR
jgi:hypothetical protein